MNESFPESEVIATLPWDTRHGAQPVKDFNHKDQGFLHDILQPVWQLFYNTFLGVFRDGFAHGWRSLTHLWQQEKQPQAAHGRQSSTHSQNGSKDAFDNLTTQSAYFSTTAQTGQSIAIDAALPLQRVHPQPTEQRESKPWITSKDTDQTAFKNSPNTPPINPWLNSVKKQQCILPLPKYDKATLQAREIARKKRQAHTKLFGNAVSPENIRGLDDIYTRPVGDLFAGEPELTRIQLSNRGNWKKSWHKALNNLTILNHNILNGPTQTENNLEKMLIPTEPYKSDALLNNVHSHQASVQETALENFETLQASVYNLPIPSTNPITSKRPSQSADPNKTPNSGTEPDYSEFIPGLSSGELSEKPRNQKPQAVKPPVPQPMPKPAVQAAKTSSFNPAEPSGISYSGSLLVAKARAARIDFNRQMPIYQEMKDEISGTDHMFRNHQILRKSMNTLTDNYFKKAAEEEANSENPHFL